MCLLGAASALRKPKSSAYYVFLVVEFFSYSLDTGF